MKKSRFSETQIMAILKQAEGGVPVPELCREHDMSNASFYNARFQRRPRSFLTQVRQAEHLEPKIISR